MSILSAVIGFFRCEYNTRHDWVRAIPFDERYPLDIEMPIRGDSTCRRCGRHVVWDYTPEPREGGSYRVAPPGGSDAR